MLIMCKFEKAATEDYMTVFQNRFSNFRLILETYFTFILKEFALLQGEGRGQVEIFSPSKFSSAANCCSIVDHEMGVRGFIFESSLEKRILEVIYQESIKKSERLIIVELAGGGLGEVVSPPLKNQLIHHLQEASRGCAAAGTENGGVPPRAGEPARPQG